MGVSPKAFGVVTDVGYQLATVLTGHGQWGMDSLFSLALIVSANHISKPVFPITTSFRVS